MCVFSKKRAEISLLMNYVSFIVRKQIFDIKFIDNIKTACKTSMKIDLLAKLSINFNVIESTESSIGLNLIETLTGWVKMWNCRVNV